jgi:hypothetical protein
MRCIVLFWHNLDSAAQLTKSCPQMALPPELIRGDAAFVLALGPGSGRHAGARMEAPMVGKGHQTLVEPHLTSGEESTESTYSNFGLYAIAF